MALPNSRRLYSFSQLGYSIFCKHVPSNFKRNATPTSAESYLSVIHMQRRMQSDSDLACSRPVHFGCQIESRKYSTSESPVTTTSILKVKMPRMGDSKFVTEQEHKDFMALFPKLVKDLTSLPEMQDMKETNEWLERVLEYNVPHGKRNRGLATALAYRYLAKDPTPDDIRLSHILGWCVEMLQAYFLVADDIMDASETRRGRPCWYKVENLGNAAFNDALLLESSIYQLIKKHFRGKSYYADVLEIFQDVNYKTVYGQSFDTRTGLERQMENYTIQRYSAIVKYKTSYYSFCLPVSLAMAMTGINDTLRRKQAEDVLLKMGHFFQVQDDFLDCFGDEEVTGKIGTDIQDCKCSWLFVKAMENANNQQKQMLKSNYGQHDPAKIQRVKELYMELKIPESYAEYEENAYKSICSEIELMAEGLPKKLFYDMVHKIYKRSS